MERRVREEGSLEQRGGKWWRKRVEDGHGVETGAVLISNPAASGRLRLVEEDAKAAVDKPSSHSPYTK